MTLRPRNFGAHRILKARQADASAPSGGLDLPALSDSPTAASTTASPSPPTTTPQATSKPAETPRPTPTPSPSPSTTSAKPTSIAPPPSSQSQATSTADTDDDSSTSTTSSPDSTSTSSSSRVLSSSSSSSTRTSASTTSTTAASILTTGRPAAVTSQSSSFRSVSRTTLSGGSTVTAPAISQESSGALSTGAIVGSVAGGLIGVVALVVIAMFILRRVRRRSRIIDFEPTDFRRETFIGGNQNHVEPPSMAQRGHTVAPSISSGPGMAGHGAYSGGYTDTPTTGYGADSQSAGGYAAASAAAAALQERPRYVYGQTKQEEEEGMESAQGGPYSSQPQPQVQYNPEAYGSYAKYEPHNGGADYQQPTRAYQGQQGYEVDSFYENGQGQGYENFVVSGQPADPPLAGPSATRAGAHGRTKSTRSVPDDDDVYGGI